MFNTFKYYLAGTTLAVAMFGLVAQSAAAVELTMYYPVAVGGFAYRSSGVPSCSM